MQDETTRVRRRQRRTSSRGLTQGRDGFRVESITSTAPPIDTIDVGRQLRVLRARRGLSIRALAELSNLNVNTLSLIENGKSSPSVSTLQQLAGALAVPITTFFETNLPKNDLTYQRAGQRPAVHFSHGTLEDLGAGMIRRGAEPFIISLEPGADSGPTPIVHTGREFVYCLDGQITYTIDNSPYILSPGDSLLFEAHLPHRWENTGPSVSRSLLVLCPADDNDRPTERHFLR